MSMKLPQLKRRRLLSNSLVPLVTPNLSAVSLKSSRISKCTSCHRTLGLKSSPSLVCVRCSGSTCAICVRTCTGGPMPSFSGTSTRNPSPHRFPTPPPLGNPSAASRRRRARNDDIDTVSNVKGLEREGTGCGRMVCRICCLENMRSETVACLDCLAAHRALKAHGSDASMQEAITDNILTAST